MNYMPYIVNYLSSKEGIVELYMAPGAFITEKRGDRLVRVSDNILTPEDTKDTLVVLRSYATLDTGPLGKGGRFSFGVKDVGRLSVSYITQRGSYVLHVLKTPYQIPSLGERCPNKAAAGRMEEVLRLNKSGIVLFQGKNQVAVNTLVYSLLQNICQNYSKIIFTLESPLSFFLKHGQSLVFQRELGVDANSLEDALRDAFHMNPDIIYISYRDILPIKEQDHLLSLIQSYSLVLLSLPVIDTSLLKNLGDRLKAWIEVEHTDAGTLKCIFRELPPQV